MTEHVRTFLFVGMLAVLLLSESIQPFFELFDRSRGTRVRHLARNLAVGAINAFAVSLGFAALWAWASRYSEVHNIGLLYQWPPGAWSHAVLAVLFLDGWTYCWDWLNHRLPLLWRFHRMHHADVQMDVTTANRFHLGEIAASSLLRIPIILLLGIRLPELVAYEAMMFAVVQLHHANIGLPEKLDRLLRVFIVTPAMHKVHHSRRREETDSNYTSLLSFWDRLFGTFRIRPDSHAIRFGLDGLDRPEDQRFAGLVKMPFVDPTRSEPPSRRLQAVALLVGVAVLTLLGCVAVHRSPTGDWPEIKRTIADEFPHVRSITTAELAIWLETADAKLPLILDARDAAEYAVSHLPGAVRINSDAPPGNLPPDLPKDAPVVVYCSVGYRSAALAQRLQEAGYTNVRNLDGSIFQWANEGRPLVRGKQRVQEVHPYDENWGRLLDRGVPRQLRP